MQINIDRCPYCNSTELLNAFQTGQGALLGENIWSGTELRHIVCRNCGSVVRSYVNNPELLLKKKDRR